MNKILAFQIVTFFEILVFLLDILRSAYMYGPFAIKTPLSYFTAFTSICQSDFALKNAYFSSNKTEGRENLSTPYYLLDKPEI